MIDFLLRLVTAVLWTLAWLLFGEFGGTTVSCAKGTTVPP